MLDILNLKTKIFIFVTLLLVAGQCNAANVKGLYAVEILVKDESASSRWAAFKQGLDEVFIRLSGDSIIMDKLKRPAPTTYVKQYSYDPVEEPETNLQGEQLTHRIKIQYNNSLVEKYLRQNGFPVWGQHRPQLVVWLAVRDGENEYVLKQNDQSLLKTAVDEALIRRGVPRRWPLYDATDKKILKIADIRGGFKDPVVAASKRYTRGPALTGSLRWNGELWLSSWSLLMQHENRHWSQVNADYNLLINKAIDQAADIMGVVFAHHGQVNEQSLLSVNLNVTGVDSIEKYRQVEHYLTELNAVDRVELLQIDGQVAVFKVLLQSQDSELLNVIENDAKLLRIAAPVVQQQSVDDTVLGVQQSSQISDTQSEDAPPDPVVIYYYQLQ